MFPLTILIELLKNVPLGVNGSGVYQITGCLFLVEVSSVSWMLGFVFFLLI